MTEIAKKLFATAYTKEINKEERTIVAWASKAVIDRDKEIIKGNAWDLKAYRKHPIIILSHNYRELTNSWIGKTLWIKPSEEGLLFKAQFATTGAAREAYQLVEDTGIAAFSVGFIPKKWEDKLVGDMTEKEKEMIKGSGLSDKDKVRIYTKCELLEISLVSIPSCSTATLTAYNEGKIKTKELREEIKKTMEIEIIDDDKSKDGLELLPEGEEIISPKPMTEEDKGRIEEAQKIANELLEKDTITKPEETEDFIHIPVIDAGKFVKDSFRTIDIDKKKGIKAVIGKLKTDPQGKTKVQKFIFDKKKGWDMKKALTWVKEHGKSLMDYFEKVKWDVDFEIEEIDWEKVEEADEKEKQEAKLKEIGLFDVNELYEIVKENKELTAANIQLNELNEKLELKAGAVLNRKNKTDLTNAQKLIQNVLDSAETSEEGKETFNCECISCGYKMTSDKHCSELTCPKCGGEMRRAERPGPGKELDEIELEFEPEKKDEGIELDADEIKNIIKDVIKENVKGFKEEITKGIDDNFKRVTGKVL